MIGPGARMGQARGPAPGAGGGRALRSAPGIAIVRPAPLTADRPASWTLRLEAFGTVVASDPWRRLCGGELRGGGLVARALLAAGFVAAGFAAARLRARRPSWRRASWRSPPPHWVSRRGRLATGFSARTWPSHGRSLGGGLHRRGLGRCDGLRRFGSGRRRPAVRRAFGGGVRRSFPSASRGGPAVDVVAARPRGRGRSARPAAYRHVGAGRSRLARRGSLRRHAAAKPRASRRRTPPAPRGRRLRALGHGLEQEVDPATAALSDPT